MLLTSGRDTHHELSRRAVRMPHACPTQVGRRARNPLCRASGWQRWSSTNGNLCPNLTFSQQPSAGITWQQTCSHVVVGQMDASLALLDVFYSIWDREALQPGLWLSLAISSKLYFNMNFQVYDRRIPKEQIIGCALGCACQLCISPWSHPSDLIAHTA